MPFVTVQKKLEENLGPAETSWMRTLKPMTTQLWIHVHFWHQTIVLWGAAATSKPAAETSKSTAKTSKPTAETSKPSKVEAGNDWTPDDESESNASVYAYESKPKKQRVDAVENSVIEMTKALSSYVSKKNTDSIVEQKPQKPELKFGYIWQNLDNLFQQLSQDDINE